ncbi:hypothetical protein ACFY2W_24495 [Streptomyces sp. NPDC001262]|uniref:hypothetical protein n=1 Tax=unclassified Streptomyces TaxID=2593676 RepID=UPI0036B674A7
MRPPRDASAESQPGSVTPIYDALCSEYRRSFRTLPGDRAGEEELRFKGFGASQPAGSYQQPYAGAYQGTGYNPAWDSYYGRQRSGSSLPALPPAPRRNF